jgi:hypothetical protein
MNKLFSLNRIVLWVAIFSIAMGLLESSVVIYLREIYDPEGINFPLTVIHGNIVTIELFRELATLIMLIIIGVIAGKDKYEKFAYFIFSFAVWDIFYYVFLFVFIKWPETLFTWDILFLIPVVWISPVICPVLVSLTMIALAIIILLRSREGPAFSISLLSWIILILGSVIVVLSFTWEYSSYLIHSSGFSAIIDNLIPLKEDNFSLQYIPQEFNWIFFIIGELVLIAGIIIISLQKFHKK